MADLAALDASTFLNGDLDPTFAPVSPRRAIAERVCRRWFTTPGTIAYAINDGENLRTWLSAGATDKQIARLEGRLVAEAEKDEGVVSASVDVALNTQTQTLTVAGTLTDADGPFDLTLSIDAVTATLLLPENT